jgi:hypothetical protein
MRGSKLYINFIITLPFGRVTFTEHVYFVWVNETTVNNVPALA